MNIVVYILKKKLDKDYNNAIEEYKKRLSKYLKIKIVFLGKSEDILNRLKKDSYKIKIGKNKKQLTSEKLAEKIQEIGLKGLSNIEILLGDIEIETDFSLELSQMDIDLDLECVLLFEQIYRSYKIINGEPYHK